MGAITTVIVAPTMAPMIVNISRYIAIFMFVIFSFTKCEAAPLDVAIMATIPHATASLTGMPNKTKIGVKMLAPPKPVRDPTKPTTMEIKRREIISSNILSRH